MPWCDACSKFWNPPQLAGSGACPTCGRPLGSRRATAVAVAGPAPGANADHQLPLVRPPAGAALKEHEPTVEDPGVLPAHEGGGDGPKGPAPDVKGAPWHFKLLVVGVTVYMIYRIYWLIEWLPKHV